MDRIVGYIDEVIKNIENEQIIANVKAEIEKWMKNKPLFAK